MDAELGLRACVRDLVALSTISAWWIDRQPRAIAESLRDLLSSMLRTDWVLVELRDPETAECVTVTGGTVLADPPSGRTLVVPVGVGGAMGRLSVGWDRQGAATETDSILLKVAATHVAIALQQAALLMRHEQAERLLAAHAARQALVARLELRALTGISLEQLLDEAAEAVRETLAVDCCELLELASDGGSLLLRAGVGWRPGAVGHDRVGTNADSQGGYTLSVGEPVVVEDLRLERRFTPSPLLQEHGVVSGVSVVILDQPRPFGVLGAHARAPRVFTLNEVQFLQSVANLLAAALQRARAEADRESLLHQAQHAVATRDRAVGIVSHDLGTPLSTIQICATALLDPDPPPVGGMRNMGEIIQRSAASMQRIVNDLLDRASLDAGRLTLDRHPTAAADVVSAAQSMFVPVAREMGLAFTVESARDLPLMDADPQRLLQVLANLLSNAMKFTPAGGRVRLSAARDSAPPDGRRPAVRFTVRDSGEGIAAEDLAHVCDWFWHAQRAGGGTGLGLAIAKDLVEAHGGSLDIASVPGAGSTFSFTVPLAPEQ